MKHTVLFLICIFGLFAYAACGSHRKNLPVLAHYKFDTDARDATGRNPDCKLKNVTFSNNAMYLNGKYDSIDNPDGYHVYCRTPSLSYDAFTVAVRFKCQKFDFGYSAILAGGNSGRWLVINRTEDKNLGIDLNNHQFEHEIKGTTMSKGEWIVVACGVDVVSGKLIVYLNGAKVSEVDLPDGFRFEVQDSPYAEADKAWMFADYSTAHVFYGLVDEMIIYERMLSEEEFAQIPLRP